MMREPPISTPCTNVCTIEARTGLCAGCGRTPAEIARWREMSEAERRAVMSKLPARIAAARHDSPED
jgi:predicted Fe-S protein YdhL (DUF1289 family)